MQPECDCADARLLRDVLAAMEFQAKHTPEAKRLADAIRYGRQTGGYLSRDWFTHVEIGTNNAA